MDQNSQTTSQNTAQNTAEHASENTASFGFRAVPETERQGLVNKVFASVAGRYDLMNDLMSGGLHRLWKREFVTMLNPPRGATPFKLLDVAGGTGDISIRYAEDSGPNATAVICDISPEMLEVGRRRIADAGLQNRIQCVEGNAEELPFESSSFDAYTIAFGIRNVTHIDKALSEAYRVLKPGGRFLCLEFSECRVPVLDRLYDFHSFEIIPRLGQLTAGDAESYRYLVESIRRFPTQEKFAELVRNAGFSRVNYRNLTGGIAAIHGGWKI
ncbi:bifunctional demethylmenaquinone methyltransferase/2-methoxy-6-polyprenyl-1,4-benzoquinol methylase UbiE [Hyphomicrobium sp.]|uniref:bifunctional demethylmenaquinone methyltransferase/2-methoxy-6-polyprenyl-1,4-benzoquinol methylase UbiE n=1 Tax=Hyphomicrobium sp. TaxID=82 RepID=UPI001E02EF8F|nr:bifunctional demethylmenaquinone methyltransferase/2-methoxy-6-polyprenyl-1,4-benzoquinol methylase UbiE [Hyphomicrobium sp.]MBY0562288.1 bifunctional demethylmenaquinone methyltransferase/2-methoxy-6-polyprenyl-1,4-benzoquinol methylase UbiE [Hyphomicrobium sp.]